MMTSIQQPELQQQTLRLYGELLCRRNDWAGQLVCAAFPGAASSGLAAAASLAGAASLTVDADSGLMKAHFRDGAYDFLVNTLDEALRALKNEIRRGRPIAIGLTADTEAALSEAVERGLSARWLLTHSSEASALEQGMVNPEGFVLHVGASSALFADWLEQRRWRPVMLEKPPATADYKADDPRRKWAQTLTTHQRSASKGRRWVWLDESA